MHGTADARATILLVEDDPGVARLEQLRLERAGYAVATAATAEEGLSRVAGGGIDLIVLDQQLSPGTSGLEFFRQVKAAGHNVPAILVTGMQEEGLLVEALRAGVRDFVPKTPNFLNHLEPIVARVLDQVRTERELAESRVVARSQRGAPPRARARDRPAQAGRAGPARGRGEPAADDRERQGLRHLHRRPPGPDRQLEPRRRAPLRLRRARDPRPRARRHLHPRGPRRRRPRARARHRRRPGPRDRRALAPPQGRQPLLRQRRGQPDLRRGGPPLRLHQGRARHHRAQPAEEAVREAAVRLKAIVDTAVDGIITMDERGHHRVDEPGRRADLRPRPRRGRRPRHRHAHARARPRRARRLPRELPPLGPAQDHRHDPRGPRPPQGRLRLPHGAGRQRVPPGRPAASSPASSATSPSTSAPSRSGPGSSPSSRPSGPAQHPARQRAGRLRLLRPRPALRPAQPRPGRARRPAGRGPPRPDHAARSCPACRPRSSTPSATCSAPARAS